MSTRTYAHGGKNTEFHFCDKCSDLMYWWPTDAKRVPRMAINARMVIDKKDLDGVEVAKGGPQKREEQKECYVGLSQHVNDAKLKRGM